MTPSASLPRYIKIYFFYIKLQRNKVLYQGLVFLVPLLVEKIPALGTKSTSTGISKETATLLINLGLGHEHQYTPFVPISTALHVIALTQLKRVCRNLAFRHTLLYYLEILLGITFLNASDSTFLQTKHLHLFFGLCVLEC